MKGKSNAVLVLVVDVVSILLLLPCLLSGISARSSLEEAVAEAPAAVLLSGRGLTILDNITLVDPRKGMGEAATAEAAE